jgi:ribose transport system substrate-binding protein
MARSAVLLASCHRHAPPVIAVIPRTSGTILWEPEHGGAQDAALSLGVHIYWNAPTREDAIADQIALVEKVASGNYQGLILAPDHGLALITPVRRAIQRGMPTVIVGSPLAIPPGDRLCYILNDEETAGRLAADRIAATLHGHGTVAILGIDPDILGIMTRARSLESSITTRYPEIHIVAKRAGSFNVLHERQVAEETLKRNPGLDAIFALTSTSMHGVLSAIDDSGTSRVRVVAFDPSSLDFSAPSLDALIVQNTQKMGSEAVREVVGALRGKPMPASIQFEPVLITRDNVNSPEVLSLTSMDWRPAGLRWRWSIGQ